MTIRPLLAIAATFLLLSATAAQRGKDPLDRSFGRWFKDFKGGRIEPDQTREVRGKKAYLHKDLLLQLPEIKETYNRLREARELFKFLKKRGTEADGKRFVQVIEQSFKKKGGEIWNALGTFSRFRKEAIGVLEKDGCPPEIQKVLVARLRKGLVKKPAKGQAKAAETLTHKEPSLAVALLPVIASFNQPEFRKLLEDFLRADEPAIRVMSAEGLARMGYGPSITAVARVLHGLEHAEDIGYLASSLGKLVPAESPKPSEKDLKFALGLVLNRLEVLEDWRSRVALVPITRMIRGRASIPVLIRVLKQTNEKLAEAAKKKGAIKAASGTLLSATNTALVDLTGFYADPRAPEKWKSWWDSVKNDFVPPPPKKKIITEKAITLVAGFFGIPVTGNRVVFVLDVSGSMELPMRTKAYVKGRTGRGAKGSFESRISRAKTELRKAVDAMPPDSKFNIVFFGGRTEIWKKKLVPATKKYKKALAAKLDKVHAGGGTMLYDGLEAALEIKLDKKRTAKFTTEVDEVFLLSDGSPTLGKLTDERRILEVVRQWTRGAQVRIHAVYMGDDVVDEDFAPPNAPEPPAEKMKADDFMRQLAKENQGVFHQPGPDK